MTGLDSSAESLDAAREAAEARGLELDFREGDMRELPFPDGSFDAVINIFTTSWRAATALAGRSCSRTGRAAS